MTPNYQERTVIDLEGFSKLTPQEVKELLLDNSSYWIKTDTTGKRACMVSIEPETGVAGSSPVRTHPGNL